MKCYVSLTKQASNDLEKIPPHICSKLNNWIDAVRIEGIQKVRKIPGYHDEPLKGNRKGERSIRLSKAYRAIYQKIDERQIQLILIKEVNKHDY